MASALIDASTQAALEALFVPFVDGDITWPVDGRVAFLRARAGVAVRRWAQPGWRFEQSFRPFAGQLMQDGYDVRDDEPGATFSRVLVLPPRQREEARALLARALAMATPGGVVVASMANAEGARSGQADFSMLADGVRVLSKHKCRVFWATVPATPKDPDLHTAWRRLDGTRDILDGRYVSRPGLFAFDRIDPASALLIEQLPDDLHGAIADLGAGYGYLACELLDRCAGIVSLDAFEAEARALAPLRENLARRAGKVTTAVHWHDVTAGLPGRYDTIVSNPPFHQGRADQPELGRAFIDAAADALREGGRFFLVANRHLPYETTLGARFDEVRVLAQRDGFKVIQASKVRR